MAIAFRILRDADRADDAVRAALISAWRQLRALRNPDAFEPWLHRILTNECYAEARRRTRFQAEIRVLPTMAGHAESTEILTRHSGKPPRGWLGPWISQSRVTPDLLQEAGYAYLLDWCHDDQPTWFRTRRGRILSVPYPQELNDIPAIVARQMDAPAFADMIVDQFREMLHQSRGQPLVMGIALHPYIVGQPYRLYHLRRALTEIEAERERLWLTTPGAIAEAFTALPQ